MTEARKDRDEKKLEQIAKKLLSTKPKSREEVAGKGRKKADKKKEPAKKAGQ